VQGSSVPYDTNVLSMVTASRKSTRGGITTQVPSIAIAVMSVRFSCSRDLNPGVFDEGRVTPIILAGVRVVELVITPSAENVQAKNGTKVVAGSSQVRVSIQVIQRSNRDRDCVEVAWVPWGT
jgi:hypothetical protein